MLAIIIRVLAATLTTRSVFLKSRFGRVVLCLLHKLSYFTKMFIGFLSRLCKTHSKNIFQTTLLLVSRQENPTNNGFLFFCNNNIITLTSSPDILNCECAKSICDQFRLSSLNIYIIQY